MSLARSDSTTRVLAVSRESEVPLAGKRAEQVELAPDHIATEPPCMLSLHRSKRVVGVIACLRNQVRSEVAGVLNLVVVSALQAHATEYMCVAAYDAQRHPKGTVRRSLRAAR